MCGRYALAGDFSEFQKEFELEEVPGLVDRYNIAPSANAGYEAPIITAQGLIFARFWYIPHFFSGPLSKLPTSFNARAETLFEKSFVKGASPCLVPTSGFREFPGPKGKKRAVCFYNPTYSSEVPTAVPPHSFFSFAGITSSFVDGSTGELAQSFAVVTTTPNHVVAPHHDRMPLIVGRDARSGWLDHDADLQELVAAASKVAHQQPLASYEASTHGNSTRVEGPACIAPASSQLSLF